eukprot:GHVT01029692.1.p1 GENE.GHVT01029692.1~~GHVT01029692.1.p1  ORF type:complete len:523 (+),score=70.71 GHVT01029692.1:407-1975(+)
MNKQIKPSEKFKYLAEWSKNKDNFECVPWKEVIQAGLDKIEPPQGCNPDQWRDELILAFNLTFNHKWKNLDAIKKSPKQEPNFKPDHSEEANLGPNRLEKSCLGGASGGGSSGSSARPNAQQHSAPPGPAGQTTAAPPPGNPHACEARNRPQASGFDRNSPSRRNYVNQTSSSVVSGDAKRALIRCNAGNLPQASGFYRNSSSRRNCRNQRFSSVVSGATNHELHPKHPTSPPSATRACDSGRCPSIRENLSSNSTLPAQSVPRLNHKSPLSSNSRENFLKPNPAFLALTSDCKRDTFAGTHLPVHKRIVSDRPCNSGQSLSTNTLNRKATSADGGYANTAAASADRCNAPQIVQCRRRLALGSPKDGSRDPCLDLGDGEVAMPGSPHLPLDLPLHPAQPQAESRVALGSSALVPASNAAAAIGGVGLGVASVLLARLAWKKFQSFLGKKKRPCRPLRSMPSTDVGPAADSETRHSEAAQGVEEATPKVHSGADENADTAATGEVHPAALFLRGNKTQTQNQ